MDKQLELDDAHLSAKVVQMAVWLSGLLPFEMAADVLKQVGGIDIPVSSVWRRTQAWGAKLEAHNSRQSRAANALPILGERPLKETTKPGTVHGNSKRMGVALDGAIIHIRKEGWKELKFGCIFDIEVQTEQDPVTHEDTPAGHAVNMTCVAHLGGPDPIGELVWAEAHRRNWERAGETIALADGAPWIWNQVAIHFGDSLQLVDWYHAQSHLCNAARLVHEQASPAHTQWLNKHTTSLYQGHAATLAEELHTLAATDPERREKLEQEAGYFQTNAHRMDYLEKREALWPIGSGVVESAAKQIKHRLGGSGMHWSRQGATHIATVRCAILGNRFFELSNGASTSPPN